MEKISNKMKISEKDFSQIIPAFYKKGRDRFWRGNIYNLTFRWNQFPSNCRGNFEETNKKDN